MEKGVLGTVHRCELGTRCPSHCYLSSPWVTLLSSENIFYKFEIFLCVCVIPLPPPLWADYTNINCFDSENQNFFF